MTQPGIEGMKNCIMLAVHDAGKDIMEVDYINAHATSTEQGDIAEAQTIKELVADKIPVSGIKGHTGHTLAACGALEVICILMMIQNDMIIPTLNLENVAEECKGIQHVQQAIKKQINTVISCNYAFGGINAAIVIEKD
jgi:3-oxoacyl-[acyl-carrier-protein] synthase II